VCAAWSIGSQTVHDGIDLDVMRGEVLREGIGASKLRLVGLPVEAAAKSPVQLFGGMRKARGGRARPHPRSGVAVHRRTPDLDPLATDAFDRLIKDLQSALGLTVLLVTHDLETVFAIASR
jgi:phospholipid/cholesterol/gamma-HCH transport system ATP-binding protein